MTFEEALNETIAMLRRHRRISYRALKRQFDVDDNFIEDLKAELIEVQQLAIDQDGKVLVLASPEPAGGEAAAGALPRRDAGPPGALRAEAERRQLTVMFCDLIDSTALSVRLDPEDFREVIEAYYEAASGIIQRFGGHIAQYLGDGLLVYHGYPVAHEDDAVRAVHSALATIGAIDELNARLAARHQVRLGVRIGVHTGPVVIGEVESSRNLERVALGETLNLGSRMQSLAAPNSVVVSATTWRLVQGYFIGEELGARTVKGIAQPILLYRIIAESGAQGRLDAAGGAATPIVGRESEVGLLVERWAQIKDDRGHVVLLSGEAGVGKSRLLAALRAHVGENATAITFRCSPFHTNSALYPVIDHLQRLFDLRRDDTGESKLDKLERGIAAYDVRSDGALTLFAALLSIPAPTTRCPPLQLTPAQQRTQTLETITAWLLQESERRPSLVLFEDLHWADPTTIEALRLLIAQIPTRPILLVLAFRPDFQVPWPIRSYFTHLVLGRLTRPQTEAMIANAAHGHALPSEVVGQIAAKSDGVPLFIEELVKMVVESGLLREDEGRYVLRGPLQSLAIPTTLQDSLMARLDRLNTAREIAQLGATIGREFSFELLRAVTEMDDAALMQGLRQIVEAEIVYARGQPPQATYFFKHALIRDAAYESLLRSRRRAYHARLGQVLEEQFADTREMQPDLLAHHFTEAGLVDKAIGYWERAGQQAVERSANLAAR